MYHYARFGVFILTTTVRTHTATTTTFPALHTPCHHYTAHTCLHYKHIHTCTHTHPRTTHPHPTHTRYTHNTRTLPPLHTTTHTPRTRTTHTFMPLPHTLLLLSNSPTSTTTLPFNTHDLYPPTGCFWFHTFHLPHCYHHYRHTWPHTTTPRTPTTHTHRACLYSAPHNSTYISHAHLHFTHSTRHSSWANIHWTVLVVL